MQMTDSVQPGDRTQWRKWLQRHHENESEIWLILLKRPGQKDLTYLDAVEEAMCFGWIDGIGKTYSDTQKAQRFTPRRKRSHWTELNKARVRRLIQLGRMTPAGESTLPELYADFKIANDIIEAIQMQPDAWTHFQSFPDLYRRVRISYIEEMRKRPDEFGKRLNHFIRKTAAGKMFGNWNDDGRLTQ